MEHKFEKAKKFFTEIKKTTAAPSDKSDRSNKSDPSDQQAKPALI